MRGVALFPRAGSESSCCRNNFQGGAGFQLPLGLRAVLCLLPWGKEGHRTGCGPGHSGSCSLNLLRGTAMHLLKKRCSVSGQCPEASQRDHPRT